jgi:hypothetical protein
MGFGPPNGQHTIQVQAPQQQSGGNNDAAEARALTQALSLLKVALSTEDSDQDKAVIASCIANIQKVLANEERERQQLLGQPGLQRALAKSG